MLTLLLFTFVKLITPNHNNQRKIPQVSKDNSGSLSLNTRKEKDTHPDYKGSVTIDGKRYWLSGWAKTNDSGDWISLSVKLADGNGEKAVAPKAIAKAVMVDDEIPF